jgi:hypothetical protein
MMRSQTHFVALLLHKQREKYLIRKIVTFHTETVVKLSMRSVPVGAPPLTYHQVHQTDADDRDRLLFLLTVFFSGGAGFSIRV